ncbi:MAG: phospholipase A [Steroidobacter sp.]
MRAHSWFMALLLVAIATANAAEKHGEAESIRQLAAYDPVYFVVGSDDGLNAKFQVSLQYKLFSDEAWIGRALPRATNFYISYSQTSLWDLSALSEPFRDSSYRPRLFYRHDAIGNQSWMKALELGVGHESNGRAGPASRSLSIAFVRPTLDFPLRGASKLSVRPLLYAYLEKSENRNIADYRGYADLEISYSWKTAGPSAAGRLIQHEWSVWSMIRKGARGSHGSVELNFAAPLSRLISREVNGWLLLQCFHGYGESLIDYDRQLEAQLRAGLAVVF